jgi:predicted dehydrogenase
VSAPRIGIVGARRERQGLGPFVARDLVRLGARVPAFVTTTAASRESARAAFERDCGVQARGYLSVDEMLASESLDALAILSPSHSHGAYLEAALGAGLPVLCDKPLVWDEDDLANRAHEIIAAFESAGLMLWENCQWPYTLDAYERLFRGALDRPPERFWMTMQPASAGLQALGDSLPHGLSLLQALIPGEDAVLEDIRLELEDPDAWIVRLAFRYRTRDWSTQAEVRLVPSAVSPRTAAYALDGRRANRCVSGDDYQLSFAAEDGRAVALDDPMTLLLADFVAALSGRSDGRQRTDIRERMGLLAQLVAAYRSWESNETGTTSA